MKYFLEREYSRITRIINSPAIAILLVFAIFVDLFAQTTSSSLIKPEQRMLAKSIKRIYKTVGSLPLYLYIFNPQNKIGGCPAIIFFHGGGWQTGGPEQFAPQSAYLVSRGMVAITVEYRIQNVHGTTPQEALLDAKSAIRWVRLHATELGIDANRIVAAGGSAGGHLAAALATITEHNEESDDLSVSCRPDALILFNPAINLVALEEYAQRYKTKDYIRLFSRVDVASISPYHHIHNHLPPTLILHGAEDKSIPLSTVQEYAQAVTRLGNHCELIIYNECGHAFFNFSRDNYHNPYYRETLKEVDYFLTSLGFLKQK